MLKQEESNKRSTEEEISVSLSGQAYEALKEIAEQNNKSIIEVLEEAIGMERWRQQIREEEARVIIERKDGRKTQLVLD